MTNSIFGSFAYVSATTSESGKVHPTSQAGFGQGKAELYDSVRASYPPEVLSLIRKLVAGKSELNVVEIGCGSGKFTRALLAHPEWKRSIKELKRIESNEGMRAVFSKTVDDSRVSLSEGIPLVPRSGSRNRGILKPDGEVCLVWVMDDSDNVAWAKQATELCLPFQDNSPSSEEGRFQWTRIFSLPQYTENFSAAGKNIVPYVEHRTLDNTIAFYMALSGVAMLPDDEKEKIKDGIRSIIDRGDGLVWVDEKEGILEVPFNYTSHFPPHLQGREVA